MSAKYLQRILLLARLLGDTGLVLAGPATALCFGGRHDLGRFLYILGALLATLGWAVARCVDGADRRQSHAYTLIAAAVALVAFQVVELKQDTLRWVSPNLHDTLPVVTSLATDSGLLSAWQTVSLAPGETRLGLSILVAHGSLFVVLLHRLKSREDLLRLASLIGLMSGGMAVIAIVQWLAPNGRMLWFYEHPFRSFDKVQGTFFNNNHFAHFVLLGIPALMFFTVRACRGIGGGDHGLLHSRSAGARLSRQPGRLAFYGWGFLLAAAVVSILLGQSRGVLVVLAVTATTAFVLMVRLGLLRMRWGPLPLAGMAVAVVVVMICSERLIARTTRLALAVNSGDFAAEADREAIWEANKQAFLASPMLGWGAGTHRFVYRLFFDEPISTVYTHAESGYLQVASETGAAGLVLLGCVLVLIGGWCWRLVGPRAGESTLLASVFVPPLVASLLHASVDFVWYVPACLLPVLAAAAAAQRLVQLEGGSASSAGENLSRAAAMPLEARLALPGLMSACLLAATAAYLGPARAALDWDNYLKISQAMQRYNQQQATSSAIDHRHRGPTARHYLDAMLTRLARVVAAHPGHIEARLRLCDRNRQRFELASRGAANAMSSTDIRDAALAANFPSKTAVRNWLDAVCGEHAGLLPAAHGNACKAIRLCPLIGDPYLALAELSFLSPSWLREHDRLIDQAVALQPGGGRVMYEAGRLLWLEGQQEKTLGLWRRCSLYPGSHHQSLATLMCVNRIPAETYLEAVEPPWQAFSVAANAYGRFGDKDDIKAMADYGEHLLVRDSDLKAGHELSRLWKAVSSLYRVTNDLEPALHALMQAEQHSPGGYWVRYEIAEVLIELGRHDEAEPHVRWCLARRPNAMKLQRSLNEHRRLSHLLAGFNGVSDTGSQNRQSKDASLSDESTALVDRRAGSRPMANLPRKQPITRRQTR